MAMAVPTLHASTAHGGFKWRLVVVLGFVLLVRLSTPLAAISDGNGCANLDCTKSPSGIQFEGKIDKQNSLNTINVP